MPKLVEWTRALNCIIWWDLAGFAHLKWPMESSWMALSTTTRLENLAFVERKLQGDMQAIWILWCCRLKRQSRFSILCAQKVARWIPCHPDSHIWADDTSDSMCHDCPWNRFFWLLPEVLYTTLIKGFARAGQVDQAVQVYEEMRKEPPFRWMAEKVRMSRRPRRPKGFSNIFQERSMQPDVITFSILIKANCDVGRPLCFWKLISWVLEKSIFLAASHS